MSGEEYPGKIFINWKTLDRLIVESLAYYGNETEDPDDSLSCLMLAGSFITTLPKGDRLNESADIWNNIGKLYHPLVISACKEYIKLKEFDEIYINEKNILQQFINKVDK